MDAAQLRVLVGADTSEFVREMGVAESTLHRFAGVGKTALLGAAAAGGAALTGMATASVKSAIDVESAFAGVIKTTDGLVDETGQLNQAGRELKNQFMDLSTTIPVSPEALMSIGELGGQLGIQKDNLLEFTKTMADLGVTTNLSGEMAAVSLARVSNIMGTAQTDIDRYGSAIVELGNNYATTEAEIVAFAERTAGAGAVAGLTEADVLGIAAAMSSVGVEAEAGGTAVQKVLLDMQKSVTTSDENLAIFASTAGMTAEQFRSAWQEDAGAAFTAFVEGLGTQGDEAVTTLDKLGLADVRLVRSFLSVANAGDLLGRTMTSSRTAWEENNALAYEASLRYGTTQSQLTILVNSLKELATSLGELVLPAFNSFIQAVSGFVSEHGPGFVKAVGNMLEGVKGFAGEMKGFASEMQTFMGDPIGYIQEHWNEWQTDMIDTGASAVSGAVEGLSANAEDWGTKLGTFLGDGLRSAFTFLKEDVPDLAKKLWDLISGLVTAIVTPENIISVGQSLFTFFTSAFDSFITALTGDPQWKEKIVAWFDTNVVGPVRDIDLLQPGKDAIQDFIDGVNAKIEDIETAISDMVGRIVNPFKNIDLKSIGSDLMAGLKEGIEGAASNVADAAKNAAGNAVDSAKDLLGIGSPSKVFELMGQNLMEGLSLGIKSEASRPVGAVTNVSREVTNHYQYNLTASYQRQPDSDPRALLRELVQELRRQGIAAPLPDVGMP